MFLVVAYDVVDDKRRQNIAKKLKDYGVRVQYSVFECILEETKFEEMVRSVLPFFQDEDSLRIYPLCQSCIKNVKAYGEAVVTTDPEVYIV